MDVGRAFVLNNVTSPWDFIVFGLVLLLIGLNVWQMIQADRERPRDADGKVVDDVDAALTSGPWDAPEE